MHNAIHKTLKELQTPGSSILETLKRVSNVDLGAAGFKFGFKLDRIGNPGGPTLAQALTEVVDQAKTDLVLIIDEVQQAISSDDGNQLLLALKAARDAINPRPNTPGYFLFIAQAPTEPRSASRPPNATKRFPARHHPRIRC